MAEVLSTYSPTLHPNLVKKLAGMEIKAYPQSHEISLTPIKPVRMGDLIGQIPDEKQEMDLTNSMIHPILISQRGTVTRGLEVAFVVDHALEGPQVFHFFNRAAPVKMPDGTTHDIEKSVYDVAADWKYMISKRYSDREERKELEVVHSPAHVPGFREFRPHVRALVKALQGPFAARFFGRSGLRAKVYPILHLTFGLNGDINWHDKVLDREMEARLFSLANINNLSDEEIEFGMSPFGGICLFPYADRDSTAAWDPTYTVKYEKDGKLVEKDQEMGPGQMPVYSWQKKHQYDQSLLMQGFRTHVFSQFKI